MKKLLSEGNQIHNFIFGSGSDFLTSYGSGSTSQKVTVPTVPVPQRCLHHSSKIKSHKTVETKVFLYNFSLLMEGSRSVQIFTDPDEDPGGPKS
jgi:hypothetical protein